MKRARSAAVPAVRGNSKAAAPVEPARPPRVWGRSLCRVLPWMTLAVLCAEVVLLWPLFSHLGTRTACYADWAEVVSRLTQPLPGGLLHWLAEWFSALWRVPVVGAAAYVGLALGVTALGRWWVRLPWWAAVLPFAAGVWQVAYCGFSVWVFVDSAFPPLALMCWGVVFAALATARRWGAWAAVLLALFPWVGMPAALGVALSACVGPGRAWSRGLRLAGAAAVVILWQKLSPADPAWQFLLLANVPVLVEQGAVLWNLSCLLVPLGALAGIWAQGARGAFVRRFLKPWRAFGAGVAACLGLVLAVWLALPRGRALWDLLACERALLRDDPKAILAIPPNRVTQHRMLGAYHIYALWRSHRLADELFDIPWPISHASSSIETMELDGDNLLYAYGLVQSARRWCYESVINRGWSAPKYALLARCALITGEPMLARRYALQLRRMPLCRAEADHLLALAGNTAAPEPELRRVAELHTRLANDPGSPVFDGAKRLEDAIYDRYALLKNGNRDMVELYLCASLLRRDTVPFLDNFEVILNVWPQRPLPRVFQQAFLAAAATLPPEKQPPLSADLFAPEMVRAFQAFQQWREAVAAKRQTVEALAKGFHRTYWFYAAFVP